MMLARISPVLALVLLLTVPTPQSAEVGPGDSSVSIVLEYALGTKWSEGTPFERLTITDGGIERAEGGFEVPFLAYPMSVEGRIASISVRFSGPSRTGFEAPPWSVPTPEGSTVDPAFVPGSDLVMEEHYRLIDLGEGPGGTRLYSLRLYPVSFGEGHGSVRYSEARVSFLTTQFPRPLDLPAERKPVGDIKYLIVTDPDLVDALRPLAEWKTQKGLFARIVTVDDIQDMYKGTDRAKKVRQYVMEMEQRYDLDYLLLAGDYSKVPTRAAYNDYPYSSYGEPGYYATDGYFACVDNGTTWNRDGDSNYAEPGEIDDPIPDLSVGRLAIDDPTTMASVVDALVERDRTLPLGSVYDVPVYMAGNPTPNPGWPTTVMDTYWTRYGDDIFPDRETLYYGGNGTMSFNSNSFKKVVDDGHQYMCYFAHGDATYIPGLYDRNDVQYLDGQAGVFFAMACLTTWFDQPAGFTGDCLAEHLTETPGKGFVGYIGASRLAVGEIDTIYSGDAPGLEEDFWRGVREAVNGDLNATTGDIYRYAVTRFSNNFYPFPGGMNDGSLRTYLEYDLLGEPDAPLITERAGTLDMSYYLSPDMKALSATVTEGGSPASGVLVTVTRFGELGRSALTDADGKATISIPPSNGGNVTITAYKRGHIPDQDYILLPDELEPASWAEVDPPAPNGLNGYYTIAPSVAIGGDEEVTVEYIVNLGGTMTIAGGTPITLGDGAYSIDYRVVDGAGLASEWANVSLKVDTTPPSFRIVTTPPTPDGYDGWFLSPVTISAGSEEPLYDIEVRMDDSQWFPIEGFDPLAIGTHDVGIRARDEAGNRNQTWTTLKVDSYAPRSTITVSGSPDGENDYYRTAPSILLRTTDPNSPVLYYSWDTNASWIEYSGPFTAPEGVHTLLFRAKDGPGNVEETHEVLFKVDTVPPSMLITTEPASPDGIPPWYRTSPTVNVDITEGTLKYALVPEGISPDIGVYGRSWYGPLSIPDGNWSLALECTDPAGNVVRTGVYSFHVDTTPPTLDIELFPPDPDGENGWYLNPPTIDAVTDPGSRVYYRIQGTDEFLTFDGLYDTEESEYVVELKAVDPAGNEVIGSTPLLRVDGQRPWVHVTTIAEGEMVRERSFNLTWEGGDNVPGSEEYLFRLDSGDFEPVGNATYRVMRSLSDGSHHFTIVARDRAGNTAECGMGFRVDATLPRALSYAPMGAYVKVGSSISVNFSEGMERSSVRISVEGVRGTIVWDVDRCILMPEVQLAFGRTYNVTVSGRDLNGNEMAPLTWEFTTQEDPSPPEEEEGGPDLLVPILAIAALSLISVAAAGIALFIRKRRDDEMEFFE